MIAQLWSFIDQDFIRSKLRRRAATPGWRAGVATERCRFVLRCAVAGSLAYVAAGQIGLHASVWAPISALVISQEEVAATLSSMRGRLVGTLLGAVVAVFTHWLGGLVNAPLTLQLAAAVAVCATFAVNRPQIRVCLWTCPLVLVGEPSSAAPDVMAMLRSSEVILGAIVGALVHLGEAQAASLLRRLMASVPAPRTASLDAPSEPKVTTMSRDHVP